MSNTIKIGTNNINAIKLGSVDVDAVYLGTNLVYTSTPPPTAQTPCYAVVNDITQYSDTDFEDVYNNADDKWYKLNNLDEYEEYGIYASGRTECGSTPSRLPSGYTEVEYVENTSVSCVDTGFKPNQDTRIMLSAQTVTSQSSGKLIGSGGFNRTNAMQFCYEPSSTGSLMVSWGTVNGWTEYSSCVGDYNVHTYDWNKNEFYRDETLVGSVTYANFQCTDNLGIFRHIQAGDSPSSAAYFLGKVFAVKIYDNGTLVRDLVPAKRDSDLEYGFYDLVGNEFYASFTSASLGGGSAVTPSQECVTTYDGKLTIDDDYEYQYSGGTWNNVGEISGSSIQTIWYDPEQLQNARFEVGHYWGEGYKAVWTMYLDGTYTRKDTPSFWRFDGQTPIEFKFYNNGFYYDMHDPTSTSSPSVYSGDYSTRLMQQSVLLNYTSGQVMTATITYGTVKFELEDGTLVYSSGTQRSGYSWYDGLYTAIIENVSGVSHVSRIQVYNANDKLVNDLKFVKNNGVTGSQEISMYDSVLNVTYNNVNSNTPIYHIVEDGNIEYPMYYETKQDPPTSVTFATMEEALQYQCPYVGLHATIGGEGYIFNEQYQWELAPIPPKKLKLTYSDLSTYDIDCDTATTLTQSDVRGGSSSHRIITSAVVGDCITSIDNTAFYKCDSLVTCTIGSGVTSIGKGAFNSCGKLTSIDIPSGVTSIGSNAFAYCRSFTSINIPNSVTSIGQGAFYNCNNLASVTVNATTPPTLGSSVFDNTNNCPIYVPPASLDAYKSSWSTYASRIQAIPTPQSSCYEIVSIPITSYTSTTYDSVYSASDEKWYMKNNLNQYEEYGIYETGTSLSDFTYYDGKLTAIGTTEYQWDGSQWQNVGVYESSETTWTIDDDSSEYQGETLLTSFKIPKEDISQIGYLNFRISVSGGELRINSDDYTYDNYDSGDSEEGTITDDGTYLNYSLPTTKEVVVENIEYWDSTPIHLIMGYKEISVEYSAKTDVSTNVYQSVAEMEAVGCPTVGVGQYGFVGNDIYKYTNNEEWIGTSLQDPKMVAFYSSGTPLVVYNNSDTTLSKGETKTSTLPIEVYVGNSVTTIGNEAFSDCSGLTSIDIPNSVTSISDSAFWCCSGLTSIDIPNSVTTIGSNAFQSCNSLTSIDIPNSVITIGNYAFNNCSGLTSVTIPNSVISIGYSAFSNTPWWNSYSADTSHQYGNIIYINDVAYVATSSGITSCTFKEGSISISTNAFSSCKRLKSIDIPNSVTSIGDSAFYNCSGLTTCTIGSGVTSIGNYAFLACSGLTSIDIPNSVISIGAQAFKGCSGLRTCTIGSGITSISEYAFSGCSGLTSIDIPNSVTTIGNYAFNNCSGLTSVTIPNSVISIGYSAIRDCKSLTSIDIPNSVTTIGNEAFLGCSGLTSIDIPNSVTTIGNYAFFGCSGLTSVTVNATTPPTLGRDVFDNTSCPIYVPSQSLETYKNAANWSTYAKRIQAIPT